MDDQRSKSTCPCCVEQAEDVGRRRLNTAYVDDERNWLVSCGLCYEEAFDYYEELWQDYYNSRL